MHITEKAKEYECCVSCKHNIRKKNGDNVYCECEIDRHYIGYIACFENVCERWVKENDNVVVWQELPLPYKAESEDNNE